MIVQIEVLVKEVGSDHNDIAMLNFGLFST